MPAGLAIVVPHHRRRDLLDGALASAAGWPILVVDDSPAGLPPGALPAGVERVRTSGSSGFARACNAGLDAVQRAGFPRTLLLNDDARLQPGCVALLLAALEADPGAGAAGPLLLDPAGRVESAGLALSPRSGRLRQRSRPPRGISEVDAVSGACVLLGSGERFDERFPFGCEDVELCRRLRRAGRRVLLVPEARCEHAGGASLSRRSREATRHALHGHLLLLEERAWQQPLALGLALAQVLREGGPPERLLGLWEGWCDARRGSTSGS